MNSPHTIGHLATGDGRVITNSVADEATLVLIEQRGARVLSPGESYTVEVGADDHDSRMAFFNRWFELTGHFPF